MQIVWIVEGGWDYEGSEILGIYSTPELADACAKENTDKRDYKYDYVAVSSIFIDHPSEITGDTRYYIKRGK
jgi:hypothetical protein